MITFTPHPDIKKLPEWFRDQWSEALQTSTQHKNSMCDENDTAHCCLCVATRLEGAVFRQYKGAELPGQIDNHEKIIPYTSLAQELRVATDKKGITYEFVRLNDEHLSHKQIAELLKGNTVTLGAEDQTT